MEDKENKFDAVMTESEFAAWLNISNSAVRVKTRDGIFVRGREGYEVRASVLAYLASMRDRKRADGHASKSTPQLDAAKLALAEANVAKVELQNLKARGDLVEAVAVEREWASILRDVRSSMLAVPSRIGAALVHLSPADIATIQSEIVAALQALAEAPATAAPAGLSDSSSHPDSPEADTPPETRPMEPAALPDSAPLPMEIKRDWKDEPFDY